MIVHDNFTFLRREGRTEVQDASRWYRGGFMNRCMSVQTTRGSETLRHAGDLPVACGRVTARFQACIAKVLYCTEIGVESEYSRDKVDDTQPYTHKIQHAPTRATPTEKGRKEKNSTTDEPGRTHTSTPPMHDLICQRSPLIPIKIHIRLGHLRHVSAIQHHMPCFQVIYNI